MSCHSSTVWSIGIGTTNECNLNCPHCYSRGERAARLSQESVKKLIDTIRPSAINFGTGENILNPAFPAIVDMCYATGCDLSLTSNGLSLGELPEETMRKFADVDVSFDFPNRDLFDRWRGEGSWDLAIRGLHRSLQLGLRTSIAACLMNINHMHLPELCALARSYSTLLRINVYKPVGSTAYVLDYDQFWRSMEIACANARIVTCSEPVLAPFLSDRSVVRQCGCGRSSLRVRPDGFVTPCVYLPSSGLMITDLADGINFDLPQVPSACLDCEWKTICGGGCEGRRFYRDSSLPDEYCPIVRGKRVHLDCEAGTEIPLVHAGYLCTIVLEP